MKNLIKEFKEMKNIPLFEIEINQEYYTYYIQADEKGLSAGGCCNIGFMPYAGLFIDWDDCFSLDEHLQELYEVCYEDAMMRYNEDTGV